MLLVRKNDPVQFHQVGLVTSETGLQPSARHFAAFSCSQRCPVRYGFVVDTLWNVEPVQIVVQHR